MLCAREQFTFAWNCSEVSDFGEVEIKGQVGVLVSDCQLHVSSFSLSDLTELECLLVDFDVRLTCSTHHLNFQIVVTDEFAVIVRKLHNGKSSIIFSFFQAKISVGPAHS